MLRAILFEAATTALTRRWIRRKNKAVVPLEQRLNRQMDKFFIKQRNAFLKGFKAFRPLYPRVSEAATVSQIAPLLTGVFSLTEGEGATSIEDVTTAALVAGAEDALRGFDRFIDFNIGNPRAVEYLLNYGSQQITLINSTTRQDINRIVVQAAEEGWSWQRTANAIGDKFESFAGPPLRPGGKRWSTRSQLVAVTELANGYEEGSRQGAKQLQDAGLQIEKRWAGPDDNRTSQGCEDNIKDGWIDIDAEFSSGHLRAPRFPGCRHTVVYRRKKG